MPKNKLIFKVIEVVEVCYPENSLPAFEKAIDLGVNTLELDIVISKDDKVVVSHEPFMNPVICYNPKGEHIPDSLGHVLQSCIK